MIKSSILSFFCLCFFLTGFCQKIKIEDFTSAKFGKTQYELINYTKFNIGSVVFVVLADSLAYKKSKAEIFNCKSLSKNNVLFYLIVLQGNEADQQELLVELVHHVDSRKKIIDSRLFIVTQTAFLESQQLVNLEKIHRIEKQYFLADFSGCNSMKEKIKYAHH